METSSNILVNADQCVFPELSEFLEVPQQISNNIYN